MKKAYILAGLMILMLAITSCGKEEQPSIPTDTVEAETGIDIDLSVLSSSQVYERIQGIVDYPYNYVGQVIKTKGTYTFYKSEDSSVIYPACFVVDSTGRDAIGLEFVLEDGNYPEEGTLIKVVGTFCAYIDETNGGMYYHLSNAHLVQ